MEALMAFNLAPLAARRDMAMLAVIHRTLLQKGPTHFKQFFFLQGRRTTANTRLATRRAAHGKQLKDYRAGTHLNVLRRSALGLVTVYNLLPRDVVNTATTRDFQKKLQQVLKDRAEQGCDDWALTFSPRVPLYQHLLR